VSADATREDRRRALADMAAKLRGIADTIERGIETGRLDVDGTIDRHLGLHEEQICVRLRLVEIGRR